MSSITGATLPTNTADMATMQVGEIMGPGTITCEPHTSLAAVAQMMAAHRIHCLVVVREDAEMNGRENPWGIVSDLDLVRAMGRDFEEQTAGDAAATAVLTITPDETLDRAAQIMVEHDTNHLVVVSRESSYPVGVLSTLDIARAIARVSDTQ